MVKIFSLIFYDFCKIGQDGNPLISSSLIGLIALLYLKGQNPIFVPYPYKKFLAKSEASMAKPRQPMRPWMPRNLFSWQKRHQRQIGFNFMASMAIKAIKTSKKPPNMANLALMAILLGRIYGIQGNNYK